MESEGRAVMTGWMAAGRRLALAVALAGVSLSAVAETAPGIRVAAAASLKAVMPELVAAFESQGGAPVRASFDASGRLAGQIRAGAPYTLFLAAGAAPVERLVDAGVIDATGDPWARGGIAFAGRRGAPVRVDEALDGLRDAVAARRLGRVTIPDPGVSAYGRAARRALQQAGLWAGLGEHLHTARHAAAAVRAVRRGPAQAGFVPLALARSPGMERDVTVAPLAGALRVPVEHYAVALVGSSDSPTAAFRAFLAGDEAAAILERYGLETAPF